MHLAYRKNTPRLDTVQAGRRSLPFFHDELAFLTELAVTRHRAEVNEAARLVVFNCEGEFRLISQAVYGGGGSPKIGQRDVMLHAVAVNQRDGDSIACEDCQVRIDLPIDLASDANIDQAPILRGCLQAEFHCLLTGRLRGDGCCDRLLGWFCH